MTDQVILRFPGMREVHGNWIHETAVIGPGVRLGIRNFVGPGACIVGNVTIGDDNWIGPHVTIGTAAQYPESRNEFKQPPFLPIVIGNRNILREYVTVHEPSKEMTQIEDGCMLMAYAHVSHDTVLRSHVALSNSVQIGGFTEIQFGATIGLGALIHQFTTIGALAMVGMGSVVAKDVPPFAKVLGNPIKFAGVNSVGMQRRGFDAAQIATIEQGYKAGDIAAAHSGGVHLDAFLRRNALHGRKILAFS